MESEIMRNIPDNNLAKYGNDVPFAFTPHVYAMHGNVGYMHCNDEENCKDAKTFYKCPRMSEVKDKTNHVPKCKVCGSPMKTHGMFFDESYSEHYYRYETIRNFYEDADALIVIGTALETSFAKRIVVEMLHDEKLVVEVNPDPCVKVGHTYQLAGKGEEMLPRIFNTFYQERGGLPEKMQKMYGGSPA